MLWRRATLFLTEDLPYYILDLFWYVFSFCLF